MSKTIANSLTATLTAILAAILMPQSALGAERIYFKYGPLLFPLSVSALEIYAHEGRITSEFARYANQLDEQTLAQLRQSLQCPLEMDEVAVYRMTETPIVEDSLRYMGQVINTPSGLNGFYAIRGALVLAAAEPGTWTMLDVIRHFPTDIRIDVQSAMGLFDTASSNANSVEHAAIDRCQPSGLFY